MKKLTSLMVLGALAAVCSLEMAARASTIDLLSAPYSTTGIAYSAAMGNTLKVGNLLFSNFSLPVGFNPGITIYGENTVPGEPGLTFVGGWAANPGTSIDTIFSFDVAALGGGSVLADDYLSVTGGISGTGQWDVAETVTPTTPPGNLLTFQVKSADLVGGVASATAVFAPEATLHISKDIFLSAGAGTDSRAFISDVTQGFSTVPVPAAAWMGLSTLGGLGVLGIFRKRARRA
jgi:hypothetical protein